MCVCPSVSSYWHFKMASGNAYSRTGRSTANKPPLISVFTHRQTRAHIHIQPDLPTVSFPNVPGHRQRCCLSLECSSHSFVASAAALPPRFQLSLPLAVVFEKRKRRVDAEERNKLLIKIIKKIFENNK